MKVKQSSPGVIRTGGYRPGMYLNKSDGGDATKLQSTVSNGAVAKILKSRAYAEYFLL